MADLKRRRMIGEPISHYRIIRQLGAGGMGVVYLARDERPDRDVAIKALSPGIFAEPEVQARFRNGSATACPLKQPLYRDGFGTIRDQDYIVLEYIPGETLRDVVSKGPISESELLRLGVMLAAGLEKRTRESGTVGTPEPGSILLVGAGLALLGRKFHRR